MIGTRGDLRYYGRVKIFLLFLLLSGTVMASTWSSYLGPNGNGTAEGKIPAEVQRKGPRTLWTAKIGKGCSSFTVADGRAFTLGNSNDRDTLWCFDAESGKVIWKKTYDEKLAPKFYDGGPGATPIVDNGRVYNLSKSGRLSCHDSKSGDEEWVVAFQDDLSGNMPTWGYSSSPVVYGDTLICLPCSKEGALVTLDKKTGKLVWQSSNSARPGYSAPVLYQHKGKDAAVVFHGRSLVGYDLSAKGEVLYEFEWRTPYDVKSSGSRQPSSPFIRLQHGIRHHRSFKIQA